MAYLRTLAIFDLGKEGVPCLSESTLQIFGGENSGAVPLPPTGVRSPVRLCWGGCLATELASRVR